MKREHITGLRTAGVSLTLSPAQRPTKRLLDKRGALLFQFRRRRMSQKLAIRRRAHGLEVLGRKRVCRLWDWNPGSLDAHSTLSSALHATVVLAAKDFVGFMSHARPWT